MEMIRSRQFVYRKEAEEGQDGGGGEAAEEQIKDGESGESGEAQPSAEIIAKAEKMGWTSKENFRGDPAKWRPADEFVERGENMLPLVKAQVKRQEREIEALKAGMKELGEYHTKTEQRAMEKALATLRQERADAIAKGDGVAFDKVDGEIEELKNKVREKAVKSQPQDDGAIPEPEFNEWLSRNAWAKDETLQNIGAVIRDKLHRETGANGIELLDLVTKEIKVRFPEKFENPRRNAAPSVEGNSSGPRKGGKTFADMPAEARAACERMAKNAYSDKPKELAAFKAEYVKSFFEGA
jgi:hypothetical protein